MKYKAAVWNDKENLSEVILTLPEQAHWSDEALLVEAGREIERQGLKIGHGRVTLQYVVD